MTSDLGSDPGAQIFEGYAPFIADVPISSYSEPFPIYNPDDRTEEEVDRIRHSLRNAAAGKTFDPPIPLADFCLIAKQKWEQDDASDSEWSLHYCELI